MRRKTHKETFEEPTQADACLQLGRLRNLVSHAQQLSAIQAYIQPLLPPDAAPHVRVLNLRNRHLILGVSSAAWIERLRFETPEVLKHLQQLSDYDIKRIQLKVAPSLLTTAS